MIYFMEVRNFIVKKPDSDSDDRHARNFSEKRNAMIQMVGTNHRIAPVEIRSLFSDNKDNQCVIMQQLTEMENVSGAVVLSTCNRTEIWIHTEGNIEIPLKRIFFRLKNIDYEKYEMYFSEKKDEDAVRHLFYLASGLKSAILAEDQILTQVRLALEFSRSCGCTDSVIEILFRMAVTAAKKVKTRAHFTRVNKNAVDKLARMLRARGMELAGAKCLVIGNGNYGKLAAETMRVNGMDVFVTVRKYSGNADGPSAVPAGCHRVDYADRMEYLRDADVIISATSSPHYTVSLRDTENLEIKGRPILCDLAVPHDVDPEVKKTGRFECYDIDDFSSSEDEMNRKSFETAKRIIEEEEKDFWYRCSGREFLPDILKIRADAAKDLDARLGKKISRLEVDTEQKNALREQIQVSAEKVMSKLLFELRPNVSEEAYREVVRALGKVYENE